MFMAWHSILRLSHFDHQDSLAAKDSERLYSLPTLLKAFFVLIEKREVEGEIKRERFFLESEQEIEKVKKRQKVRKSDSKKKRQRKKKGETKVF